MGFDPVAATAYISMVTINRSLSPTDHIHTPKAQTPRITTLIELHYSSGSVTNRPRILCTDFGDTYTVTNPPRPFEDPCSSRNYLYAVEILIVDSATYANPCSDGDTAWRVTIRFTTVLLLYLLSQCAYFNANLFVSGGCSTFAKIITCIELLAGK